MPQVVTLVADRYQVVAGRVFTVRRGADGSIGRGEMPLAAFAAQLGSEQAAEGWYDGDGQFLGDEPAWPF